MTHSVVLSEFLQTDVSEVAFQKKAADQRIAGTTELEDFLAYVLFRMSEIRSGAEEHKHEENKRTVQKISFTQEELKRFNLPSNVQAHILNYGVQVSQFGENYTREPSTQDLIHIAEALIDEFALFAKENSKSSHLETNSIIENAKKVLKEGAAEFIRRELNIYDADDPYAKPLSHKKFKNKIKKFKAYLNKQLMPQLLECLNDNKNDKAEKLKHLEDFLNKELEYVKEKGRPSFVHIDSRGQITAEFPIAMRREKAEETKEKENTIQQPYTQACYDRRGGMSNLLLRVHAHREGQDGNPSSPKVIVERHYFRSANFVPTAINDAKQRYKSTKTNLEEYALGTAEVELTLNEGEYKNKGGSEKIPILLNLDQISLLSMLPEFADDLDPQSQREQALTVHQAMADINKADKVHQLHVNGETKYVKFHFNLMSLGVNSARFFPAKQQSIINRQYFNALFAKAKQQLSEGVFKDLDKKESNETLEEAFDQALILRWFYKDEILEDLSKKSYDYAIFKQIRDRFLANEKYIKSTLGSLHKMLFINQNSDLLKNSDDYQQLKRFYHFISALYSIQSLYYHGIYDHGGLNQRNPFFHNTYNYLIQLNIILLASNDPQNALGGIGHVIGVNCNDGKDRTGIMMLYVKSAEIFQQQQGYFPRFYDTKDMKQFFKILSQQQHVDAALETTAANTRGAVGFQAYKRDGLTFLSPRLAKFAELSKGPFGPIFHKKSKWGAFKSTANKLFKKVFGRRQKQKQFEKPTDNINTDVRSGDSIALNEATETNVGSNPANGHNANKATFKKFIPHSLIILLGLGVTIASAGPTQSPNPGSAYETSTTSMNTSQRDPTNSQTNLRDESAPPATHGSNKDDTSSSPADHNESPSQNPNSSGAAMFNRNDKQENEDRQDSESRSAGATSTGSLANNNFSTNHVQALQYCTSEKNQANEEQWKKARRRAHPQSSILTQASIDDVQKLRQGID